MWKRSKAALDVFVALSLSSAACSDDEGSKSGMSPITDAGADATSIPTPTCTPAAACDTGCGAGTCTAAGYCALATFAEKGKGCNGSSGARCDGFGLCVPAALAAFDVTTNVAPFNLPSWENRVDIDGDGAIDRYWTMTIDETAHVCRLTLHRLDGTTAWSASIPDCATLARAPVFHSRSFMGSAARDFTQMVIRPSSKVCNPAGDASSYFLMAGDGETGQIRKFEKFFGNANRAGVMRQNGVQVVDFQLPSHPGPALMVRTSGDFFSHVYYFPAGDSYVELTAPGGPASFGSPTPFPGVDLPNDDASSSGYTWIYDAFNAELKKCAPIAEAGITTCGVPDVDACMANGHFLGLLAIGDIDADGVDDAHETFLWRSVAFPGRPKGNAAYLGAPQYDHYYSPQSDGSACHSGRHYGLSILAQIDDDQELEEINVAGLTVDQFNDLAQNVSRNLAVVDSVRVAAKSTIERKLLWNRPLGTSIGVPADSPAALCNPTTKLYDNAVHYVGDGTVRDASGKVQYITINRFTETTTPPTACAHTDEPCRLKELASLEGFWSWELVDAKTGNVVGTKPIYAWDMIPDGARGTWIVYSADATQWNLGSTVTDGILEPNKPATDRVRERQLRNDLTIALLEPNKLELTHVQRLPIIGKPWLRTGHWQTSTNSVGHSANTARMFARSLAGGPELAFITDLGLDRFVFDGAAWTQRPFDAP